MDEAFFEAFKCFEPNEDAKNNDEPTHAPFIECDITDIEQEHDEQKLHIKSCKSMERLSQILTYYISWMQTIDSLPSSDTPSIGMFDIINSGKYLGKYNNTQLLNDFHHILQSHKYSTINTLFLTNNNNNKQNKQCIANTDHKICNLLLRNYRNRNSNYNDNNRRVILYHGYNVSTEITTQQILDYIHSFIYHSYDLGLQLKPVHLGTFNDHLLTYQNQLIEEERIEYSKTPNPPIFQQRSSILYNQKIEVEHLEMSSNYNTDADTEESEDSLSADCAPSDYDFADDEKNTYSRSQRKFAPHLTPSFTPVTGKGSLCHLNSKPMESMILAAQTGQKLRDVQDDVDSKLLQHIKLSNSKIVVLKQIMDEINAKSQQLHKRLFAVTNKAGAAHCKFINVLASYRELISEFEPGAESNAMLIKSKSTEEEKKENVFSIKSRHRKSSSVDHQQTQGTAKSKLSHSKTRSLAKLALKRVRSEKTKNFLKRNKKRTATVTVADYPKNRKLEIVESPRSTYVNNAINDTTNGGLTFDFGVRYYYWPYYKENNDKDKAWNNGRKYKYWYIAAKENNLKLEMFNLSQYNPKHAVKVKHNKNKKSEHNTSTAKVLLKLKNKLSLRDNTSIKKQVSEKKEAEQEEEADSDGDGICGMSMEQWNDIEERAHCLHKSIKCKQIKCDLSIWAAEYGINEADIIKKQHIIALLIFCTFDRIRNEFLLTFNQYYNTALLAEDMINKNRFGSNKSTKKKNKFSNFNFTSFHYNYERGIESMKKNHSFFSNLGRLLREAVECFGERLNNNMFAGDLNEEKIFYFGVNNGLGLFKKTLCQFKLPLLCSSSANVLLNYISTADNNDGLLIEIKYYDPFIRYFDCSFFTEFCSENECIFFGGLSQLKIETIYCIFLEHNYKNFIRAMNILQSMLSGKMKKETMTENEQQIIRYLVQNEFIRAMNNEVDVTNNMNGKSIIPQYISLLFHHFCINLNKININLHRMNDKTCYGYFAIKSLFLTSQNNFIKLDVLCSLFPNVPIIKVIGDTQKYANNCIKLDQLFFEEVLLILDSNLISRKCALKKIIISFANETDMTIEYAIAKYKSQFDEKDCVLKIKPKTRELVIQRGLNLNNNVDNAQNDVCLIQ